MASRRQVGSLQGRPDVLWRRAAGSVLLLAPEADQPLVVSGSGAAMWEALLEPTSLDDLLARLAAVFELEVDDLRADVVRTLDELDELGLLTRT